MADRYPELQSPAAEPQARTVHPEESTSRRLYGSAHGRIAGADVPVAGTDHAREAFSQVSSMLCSVSVARKTVMSSIFSRSITARLAQFAFAAAGGAGRGYPRISVRSGCQ